MIIKMYLNFWSAVSAAFFVSLIKCAVIKDSCIRDGATEDRCMPNGEIHHYICTDMKTNPGYGNQWVRDTHATKKCLKNDKCTCYKVVKDLYDGISCECDNSVEAPKFPTTGILHIHENLWRFDEYGESSTAVSSEVHVNDNGRYLKKWTDSSTKGVRFVIIIPTNSNGTFYELTGSEQSKTCKVKTVVKGGGFNLWQTASYVPPYRLTEVKEIFFSRSRPIARQKWYTANFDEVSEEFTWVIYTNIQTGTSFPVEYIYEYADHMRDIYRTDTTTYTYEKVKENNESFKVEDYCDNEIL